LAPGNRQLPKQFSRPDTQVSDHQPARAGVSVSVLMPVHNAGAFLREAVDSILAQSFTDFEFVIINDGSTDGAFEALRSLTDPRLRLVDNPRNLGLIATLNRGLELAGAPLLARMDADDVAEPDRLARQVAAFDADPDLALLGSWAVQIDAGGRTAGLMRTPVDHAEILHAILANNTFIHPSVVARADVLRRLGGYPREAVHAEDYALWLQVVARHKTANLAEPLLRYRIHAGQVSQRKLSDQRAMARRLQDAARLEFDRLGVLLTPQQPPRSGRWSDLKGRPGTLGYDYLALARRNRLLGDARAGRRCAVQGVRAAPLCLDLWRECIPPKASPRYWWARLRSC
jgi:hypothetical protein